jgi:hypothetical protein
LKLADRRGEIEPSSLEFDSHCRDSRILERRKGQPVLLAHTDSTGARLLTRIWYPKGRWWSSDRIWPYSDRFRRALAILRERGVRVPEERSHGRIAGTAIRFVVFEALEGTSLRAALPAVDLKGVAAYVAELHAKGVYCRSLHLGSVIALDAGGYALVDVADTKLLDRSLPLRMRERSLGIFCAHPAELEYMLDGRWSELVMEYCRAARLTLTQSAAMLDRVRVQIERRRAKRERQRELQVPTVYRARELAGSPGARQR